MRGGRGRGSAVRRTGTLAVIWIVITTGVVGATDRSSGPEGQELARGGIDGLVAAQFLENLGQWDPGIAFVAVTDGLSAELRADGITLRPQGPRTGEAPAPAVTLRLGGGAPVRPRGVDPLPGVCHFYRGEDPSQWRTGVRRFSRAVYSQIHPGIDLQLRFSEGDLEYDLLLAPGADPAAFVGRLDGATSLRIDECGALIATTEAGELRQLPLRSWVVAPDGSLRSVECGYRLLGDVRFGFQVNAPADHLLVIDPVVEWSTYYGGTGGDNVGGLRIDPSSEDLFISGWSNSPVLPQGSGGPIGQQDGVAARIDPNTNTVEWVCFIGGTGDDSLASLDFGPAGEICIVGTSASSDFPVNIPGGPPSLQPGFGGLRDGVVLVLDPSTGALQYSTYLGGSGFDFITSSQVAGTEMTVGGFTQSSDFPVVNPYQATLNGVRDGMLARVDLTTGQLTWSTYFGGSGAEFYFQQSPLDHEGGVAVAVDPTTGVVSFCGRTPSNDLPVQNAHKDVLGSGSGSGVDAFVARLDPSLSGASQLLWSTYLGGGSSDSAMGMHLLSDQRVAVSGYTYSPDFPTTAGAIDSTFCGSSLSAGTAFFGSNDGFIAILDPALPPVDQLQYSTFVGGCGGFDPLLSILEWDGLLVSCGTTQSTSYPLTPGALQTSLSAPFLPTLVIVDPDAAPGNGPVYSTLYGGCSPRRNPCHIVS